MTTPNNLTPPPGMEILTDYTRPLPKGALVWHGKPINLWHHPISTLVYPDKRDIYATPITHPATELTIPPEVAAEVERAIDTSQEYREKTKDANFGTYGHPATGDAKPVEQRQELLPCPFCGSAVEVDQCAMGNIIVHPLNSCWVADVFVRLEEWNTRK